MNIIAVDWGKDIRKRSAYRAELATRSVFRFEFNGSLSHLIECISELEPPVLIGIDAAIGFPIAAWVGLIGKDAIHSITFAEYLLNSELPRGFFDPVRTPEQWSPKQPFVQPPSGRWSLAAFIEASHNGFHRQIGYLKETRFS